MNLSMINNFLKTMHMIVGLISAKSFVFYRQKVYFIDKNRFTFL